MKANSTAETERKWIIRGVYPDGKPLRFSVNAFDHSDAKKKAEARKGGAKITDIVLNDALEPSPFGREERAAKLSEAGNAAFLMGAVDALKAKVDEAAKAK